MAANTPISPAGRCHSSSNSHSPTEWESQKWRIAQLYRIQDLSLSEVMAVMERNYGFSASIEMLKSKITAWRLDKNNKQGEAAAILREKRKREEAGERCVFLSHGWLVNTTDVERYCKRKKIDPLCPTHDEHSDLPDGTVCMAIPTHIGMLDDPDRFASLRALLYHTSVIVDSVFDTGLIYSKGDDEGFGYEFKHDHPKMYHIRRHMDWTRNLVKTDQAVAAGTDLRYVFGLPDHVVRHDAASPNTTFDLVDIVSSLLDHHFYHMGMRLLAHLEELCVIMLKARHPFTTFVQALRSLIKDDRLSPSSTFDLFYRSMLTKRVGNMHIHVLFLEVGERRDSLVVDLDGFTSRADHKYGVHSRRNILMHNYALRMLQDDERWADSESCGLGFLSIDRLPYSMS